MIEILENNEKYIIDADFNIKGKDKEFRDFLKARIRYKLNNNPREIYENDKLSLDYYLGFFNLLKRSL